MNRPICTVQHHLDVHRVFSYRRGYLANKFSMHQFLILIHSAAKILRNRNVDDLRGIRKGGGYGCLAPSNGCMIVHN